MKKIYLLLFLFAFALAGQSQQLMHEPFNYTPDATLGLSAQSNATWLVVNSGDSILVEAGNLSYPGLEASSGNKVKFDDVGADYYTIFASQTAGSVYASFLLNVSSLGGLTTTGGYFFTQLQAGSTSLFGAAVWTRLSTTAGKYNIGISTRSNSAVSWLPNDIDPGTTVFVVTAYDMIDGTGNNVARIWLNTSAIGAAEPTADATAVPGTDMTSVERVMLRQANATGTPFIEVDEIRVGTTWSSVTPPPAGAPTLTAGTLTDFGNVTVGNASASQSFDVSGSNLTGAPGSLTVTAPSTDFEVSNDNSTWGASTTIAYATATLAATTVYVRFTPQTPGVKSGNVNISGGGASADVAVLGTGDPIAPPAAPVALAATALTSTGFTANWDAVSGATGYFLDVYTSTTGTAEEVIAGWNFTVNDVSNQTADAGNVLNLGIQTINTNSGGTVSWPAGPSTGVYSVSSNNWHDGMDLEYWETSVNTTGATGIKVSSRQYGSNTGPRDFKLQYRVGAAGAFTDVPGGTILVANSWGSGDLVDLPLPADADNQPVVYLRWIVTSTTSINGGTVASGGTDRISQVAIKGSVSATVINYVPGYQDLSVGNVTNYLVTGLTPATEYHYVVRAANAGGPSANSNEIDVTTLPSVLPTIAVTPLQSFGNVCTGTTAGGANSFVITGSNLTAADITIASLSGFTYSTNIAGPYTSTLTLTQPGGSYSETIHVQFSPVAVQSYDGDIVIDGGGIISPVNVPVTGAGVNTPIVVTTGGASAITQNSATTAGNIAAGCDPATAYGVEYSTTSGFATGTQVAGSNIDANGDYTVDLTGLTPSTTYYYKAYAVNGSGTSYGAEQSFTTTAPPITLTASALAAFGPVCTGETAGPNSFTITGSNLTTANITVGPLTGYSFSTTAGGTYTASLSITQAGGNFSQEVFVKFLPVINPMNYDGNIPVSGGGATAFTVAASGSGIHTGPEVTTNAATAITTSSAMLAGSIGDAGCSQTVDYGFEYSTVNNFANGTGTQHSVGAILENAPYSAELTGLTPATTYYYKAFARNSGATTYGAQQSFTTESVAEGFNLRPVPAPRGGNLRVTMSNVVPGYYGIQFYNSSGSLMFQKNIHVQANYIDQVIAIPGTLNSGVYRVVLVNHEKKLQTKTILVI